MQSARRHPDARLNRKDRHSTMPSRQEVTSFIRATFRSVWSLELLLFLKNHDSRGWSRFDLVTALRGSDVIVSQSVDSLVAAGLVSTDEDGAARYSPVSQDLRRLVEGAERMYAKSPDAVRRMIIASANEGLTAFADAFRLRKE
jgi:hypothetical protein